MLRKVNNFSGQKKQQTKSYQSPISVTHFNLTSLEIKRFAILLR
jgi:hypothetical protein